MNKQVTLRINKKDIPLMILFCTVSLKWLFEGVLGQPLFELFFLCVGIFLLICRQGLRINKVAAVWLFYIFNIIFSVLIHRSSMGIMGRALIIVFITSFALFVDYDIPDYKGAFKFLIALGVVNGFFVVLQFGLKENFNNFYFPYLIDAYQMVARHYYRQGYFFGLLFNPHEASGLIGFAVVLLILWSAVNKRKDAKIVLFTLLLLFPFLLTQKKGVIGISILALILTLLVQFGSKKQWKKVGILFLSLVAAYLVFRYYILPHANSALFFRLQQFVAKLTSGASVDSGRSPLYDAAIYEWKKHKLLGIGWRRFNGLTTSVYGYSFGHEVNRDYLQWLCETGVVGLILNLIPVSITLYRTITICRHHIRKIQDPTSQWIVLFAVFVQIFTLIYAWIEIPFYDIVFSALYIFSCIVINSAYRRLPAGKKQ